MKKLICAIIVFVVLGSLLVAARYRKNDMPYKTEKITRGDIRAACTATGTVNPLTTVLVGTQVSGRIKEIYADYNSPVTRGQLIAEIDPATFDAQLEQARANLLSAQASVEKAKATHREAKRNLARKTELFQSSIIGKSELDAEETNYEVAKSQVGVAEAQVVQTEAAFKIAETNLRYTKIISPVDGIVISRNVDIGQTVAASFQTPTLFTIAQDLNKMQINTNVDEADIGKIALAQDAEFTVDAYPEETFMGKVVQIRNAPVVVQNVVTYDVVITVDNPALKLKPGMTANVFIVMATKKDILLIPNAALRFRPKEHLADAVQKEHAVWTAGAQAPESIKVKTGISDSTSTELLEGDLAEGQDVLVGYADKDKK
ncbi:MAG: efflux RND transporter periplasmic adaptor subunit [Pseudomonadota bacterium]